MRPVGCSSHLVSGVARDGQFLENLCRCIADRAAGRIRVPAECLPEETPCTSCNSSTWHRETQAAVSCTVFLLGAAVETSFPTLLCGTPGCTGSISADGREQAILRQSAKHAFSYELLYDWADKTGAGGAPWFTFWRDVLQRCAL